MVVALHTGAATANVHSTGPDMASHAAVSPAQAGPALVVASGRRPMEPVMQSPTEGSRGLRKLNLPTVGATQAAAEAAAAAMGSPSFSRMDRSTSLSVSETVPVDAERTRYFRRLSALPPVAPHMPDIPKPVLKFVDATRGVLFALSQIYSALHQHMAVSTDERLVAHFQRVLSIAARSMSTLIAVLDRWDHSSQAGVAEPGIVRHVLESCYESVRTFRRAVSMLHSQLPQLGQSVDVRFTRTLLLLLYGSMAELKNSADMMLPQAESVVPYVTSEPVDASMTRMRGSSLQDVSLSQDAADTCDFDDSVPATSTPLSKRSARVRPGASARSPRDACKHVSPRVVPVSPSNSYVLRTKPATASVDELDDTLTSLLTQVTDHAMAVWTELGAYVDACLRQDDDHDEGRLRRLRDVQEACTQTLEHTRYLQATHERFSDDHVRTTGADVHQLWEEANQFVRSIIHISTLVRAVSVSHPFPRDLMRGVGDLNQGCSALAIHLHKLAT
ncbi:RAM signaling network component [Malassezia caprae]|uniref:RAM signaling network component n=1 Tax=Malassezia caprae TaxID=1381934 RepID=A0AAF0E2L5_9BASI|nr:RAM signaling network component [Malassezia caprae]